MTHGPHVPERLGAVVIGASAGGVQALRVLLGRLPSAFAPPVLIVQHILSDRPSMLAGLYTSVCARPVCEAEDKQPLVPGRVVFAPPGYHLLVEDRECVALSIDEPVLYSRPSIDVLLESASRVFSTELLAIILTGASADGAEGARAVRRAGGKVWIQAPADAEAPIMPEAALAIAGADAVLSLRGLADGLHDVLEAA